MSSVGEQFRAAREHRKLTLHQVAEATKIRTDHLAALEAGDYDRFVAPVYIRGFARTYATLLKLDVPAIIAGVDEELAGTKKFSQDPSLTPPKQGVVDALSYQISRINWQKLVLFVIVVLLLAGGLWGLIAWRWAAKQDPLQGLKPPMFQTPTNSAATDVLPLPPPPAPAR